MDIDTIKQYINTYIYSSPAERISGNRMNDVLSYICNNLTNADDIKMTYTDIDSVISQI